MADFYYDIEKDSYDLLHLYCGVHKNDPNNPACKMNCQPSSSSVSTSTSAAANSTLLLDDEKQFLSFLSIVR